MDAARGRQEPTIVSVTSARARVCLPLCRVSRLVARSWQVLPQRKHGGNDVGSAKVVRGDGCVGGVARSCFVICRRVSDRGSMRTWSHRRFQGVPQASCRRRGEPTDAGERASCTGAAARRRACDLLRQQCSHTRAHAVVFPQPPSVWSTACGRGAHPCSAAQRGASEQRGVQAGRGLGHAA